MLILQLAYLDAIINETLRLYPPIWSLARPAVQDDRFGNYRIRKGTTIFIVPLITQCDRRRMRSNSWAESHSEQEYAL